MKYLFFLIIFLIPVGVANASTYSSNNPTVDGHTVDGNNDICDSGSGTKVTGSVVAQAQVNLVASVEDCYIAFFDFDLSSIPTGALITDVDFRYAVASIGSGGARNCDYVSMGTTRGADTGTNIFNSISTGTVMLSNNVDCSTVGVNKSLDFGATGDAQVQARVNDGSQFFSFGIRPNPLTIDAFNTWGPNISSEDDGAATPKPTLIIIYTTGDAVTDLHATDIRGTAVDLEWSTPNFNGSSLVGYNINDTTPWANPLTIINPNTNSLITSYTVSPLTGLTNYSFRVAAGGLGGNASGNILNITTDFDPTASFTPGTFDITLSGEDLREFKFNRTDTATTTILGVTYPKTFNATCNFYFKFALTNNTFTNLADVPVNSLEDKATFTFQGLNNDIIDVNCFDTPSNVTGRFLITQSHFAFQDQIDNFKNGTFGTHGQFGAFDLITIFAVLFSMIGFNRINAPVGAVLSIVVLGAFAYFGLIQWYTGTTVLVAIVILFAFTTHRDSGD